MSHKNKWWRRTVDLQLGVCVFNLTDWILVFAFTHSIFPPHPLLGSCKVPWNVTTVHCLPLWGPPLRCAGWWLQSPGLTPGLFLAQPRPGNMVEESLCPAFGLFLAGNHYLLPFKKVSELPQIKDCWRPWKAIAGVPVSSSSEPCSSFCSDHTLSWLFSSSSCWPELSKDQGLCDSRAHNLHPYASIYFPNQTIW